MTVQNYYAMSEPELDERINTIRNWLFSFTTHPEYPRSLFALEVALNAKELKKDSFIELLIDTIC